VTGVVQGVGFRPHVFRLAKTCGLTGAILNLNGSVAIEAEGYSWQVAQFRQQLLTGAPMPIQIDSVRQRELSPRNDTDFTILPSSNDGRPALLTFPADLAVCSSCIDEIYDAGSRFHHYSFISCTNCGPRFTVIRSLPYDRPFTSLHDFPICPQCNADFRDAGNRRFHAQTVACPICGPALEVLDGSGRPIRDGDPLSLCRQALAEGSILAVKGVGGFHLICDAYRQTAIESLRRRKRRPTKPFALMAKSLAAVMEIFEVSETERQELESSAAPIVLLLPKTEAARRLPLPDIAPGLARIGVFLPYSPLHRLLFHGELSWLVATSGNPNGLPTCRTNREAVSRLRHAADLFVVHNREIVVRADDSVGQETTDGFQLLRRSRGYVPAAIEVPLPPAADNGFQWPVTLGMGAETKNTFCFIVQGKALFGPHIGDTSTVEGLSAHEEARLHFERLLSCTPRIVAYDPHPDYAITRSAAEAGSTRAEAFPVYHHHAHLASCMGEHRLASPVIGCILDGTGYGPGGELWGFEILTGDYLGFTRVCHLKPIRLPGGEAAIRHPWITGLSLLHAAVDGSREAFLELASRYFPQHAARLPVVLAQLEGRIPSPEASSAGRLFDGISAVLNVCTEAGYEGEAAIRLSELLEGERASQASIPLEMKYRYERESAGWNIGPMVRDLLHDLESGHESVVIAYKFHHTIAHMVLDGVKEAQQRTGLRDVVLSGGVWSNRYLYSAARTLLERQSFRVYGHKEVPAGDGGIALGQALCGLWRWARKHVLIGTVEGD
jgi:hydrogenase maturation protein HypF